MELVLDTVKRGVIDDIRIPRSTKLAFFHHVILQQIIALYTCSDSSKPRFCSCSIPERTIADIVHSFMQSLCLTPGEGICFQDSGWGIKSDGSLDDDRKTMRVNNPLLSKLLLSLKVVENPLQRQLFLEILDCCPELVHQFWSNATHLSFEPRSSIYYISNVALATSIINLEIPKYFGAKIDETTTMVYPPIVAICISNILPAPLNRASSSKALQFSARDVRFTCGKQLAFSFAKLEKVLLEAKNLKSYLRKDGRLKAEEYVNLENEWSDWERSLLHEFRQQLPDPQIIISLQKSSKQAQGKEDDGVTTEDLSISHLELLKYYQLFNQEQMRETRYDFGKLLSTDLHSWSSSTKYELIEILISADGFKWWNKIGGSKRSGLGILLDFYVNEQDTKHKDKLEYLFDTIFGSSFCFQGYRSQSNIVWKCLLRYKSDNAAIDLIENVLLENHKSPFALVDRMVAFCHSNGFDEKVEFPFAPIFLQLADTFLTDSITNKMFVCSLIIEDCVSRGLISSSVAYLIVITSLMEQISNHTCPVFASLHNWLLYTSGKATHHNFMEPTWKSAKSELKKCESFPLTLFGFSPKIFHGHWKDLFGRHQEQTNVIELYIDLNLPVCEYSDPLKELCDITLLPARQIGLLLSQRELIDDRETIKLFQGTIATYFSESEQISTLFTANSILFWIDSMVSRYQRSSELLLFALQLLNMEASTMKYLRGIFLAHPIILHLFLPKAKDQIYSEVFYSGTGLSHFRNNNHAFTGRYGATKRI